MQHRRLPELLDIYVARNGTRWVVLDVGDADAPRSDRTVTLRLDGTTGAHERKTITMAFFLATYTLAEDQHGFVASPAPAQPMTLEARRAANMRRLRRERGYNRARMSDATGIGHTYITEMERGHRSISIRTIDRLGAGLGMPPAAVLAELDK